MPPADNINKDFLRDVFKREKKLLKKDKIKMIDVPHYEELNVRDVLKRFKDEEKLLAHIPTNLRKGKPIARPFFFNVLNTLYPGVVPAMINNARAIRNEELTKSEKKETIDIVPEWVEELKSVPFTSSK